MAGRIDCPLWCAEDVADGAGLQHQVIVGDVRLTRRNAVGRLLTVCAVRQRGRRTPAQVSRLAEDLAAASQLLRREHATRHVAFRGNSVVHEAAPRAEKAVTAAG